MRLACHYREDVGDFCLRGILGSGEDFLDAGSGVDGWRWSDFEGLNGELLVDEDGEACVEEFGEDVGEGWGVDEVRSFVEEAAERGWGGVGGCGVGGRR